MKSKVHPSQETLKKYFDVVDGKFVRKIRTGHNTNVGEVVNGYVLSGGHRYLKFNDSHFAYHRLLWIYFNGDIPEGFEVDHIDCNRLNNCLENLRLATRSQNNHNRRFTDNSTGHKDITEYSKTKNGKVYYYYLVGVKLNGIAKRKNFPCTEDGLKSAIEYRNLQIELLHGEFGRIV